MSHFVATEGSPYTRKDILVKALVEAGIPRKSINVYEKAQRLKATFNPMEAYGHVVVKAEAIPNHRTTYEDMGFFIDPEKGEYKAYFPGHELNGGGLGIDFPMRLTEAYVRETIERSPGLKGANIKTERNKNQLVLSVSQ